MTTREPESTDKPAAARGIRNGILIMLPFWCVICAGVAWVVYG